MGQRIGVMGAVLRRPRTPLEETGRVDLRETACMPYPPVGDQGDSVSCLAHAFAAALYCSRCLHADVNCNPHPHIGALFASALRRSSDPRQGLSFQSIDRALDEQAAELGCRVQHISNSAAAVRAVIRAGIAVVLGYQVNVEIDEFHRSTRICKERGFILPSFGDNPRAVSAHAVLIVGYDFGVQCFIVRNSWGAHWGMNGHCLLRFRDIEDRRFATDIAHLTCSGQPRALCR